MMYNAPALYNVMQGVDLVKQAKHLSDAELEIMMVLWDAKAPVSSTYIKEQLKGKRAWALSTLMTVLARLCEKQFVVCDRSTRTNLYSAAVQEAEYKAGEGKTFLSRLYGNSITDLVTNLYQEDAITEEDLKRLRSLLDTLKEG